MRCLQAPIERMGAASILCLLANKADVMWSLKIDQSFVPTRQGDAIVVVSVGSATDDQF
jgi:hypothetical protein